MKKVTNKELTVVSSKNETSERILRMVADRRRNTVYTAFSGLRADLKKRDGKPVDRKEFDETFKELAKIGAGQLECSKRGVCRGFHWSIPVRHLGTILKNRDEVGVVVNPMASTAKPPKTEAAKSHKSSGKVTVVILRKNGEPKTIQIPERRLRELEA